MRIAVLGAGAMGGTVAALLARAGHEVEVTARGPNLAAIAEHGIRLSGAWGEYTAAVLAGPRLTVSPGLAIVATKAMDAAAVVRENADVLAGVPLVVIQNGLGGLESVIEAAGGSDVVGALSMLAASYVAPGEITVTAAAHTYVGSAHGSPAAAQAAASVLNTALPTSVVDNFEGARWTKLLVNQVNALPAITGTSVQAVIDDPRLRRIMTRSMRETARVGLARGVRFATLQGITPLAVWALAHAPLWVGERVPRGIRKYLGDVPNPASTLQSIRRGQPSEIDFLNGAVVEQALGTDVATPVNRTLTDLVHEVERTGRHLSTDEVVARVSPVVE
ncbi:2-dehydropantoate 2-reductase [Diaminobutyricimonas sp. TR449]|uniref:ketopantoate reductase family protein n=1 Tax=Diaminobutyricimonas sp. TR449 TaxID=2708076 RepID=UPI001423A11F|nr:2-dehydropantoate 2-reductase [Diaminobutyricimonas sp. TR449]